jgi:hypothetical protein
MMASQRYFEDPGGNSRRGVSANERLDPQARPGNSNAVKSGAQSVNRIRPVARSQKRRLLRQIGLASSDLDGVGRALLDNWARAQAKVELCDRHFQQHGFLDAKGEPKAPSKIYFTAVNSARLALTRLREHLQATDTSPLPALGDEGRRVRLEAETRLRAVK